MSRRCALRSLVVDRLSSAKRIILIGHGPGVLGISELLESRSEYFNYFRLVHISSYLAAGVMRFVKLVVQVVGYTKIPLVPKKGPDLSAWYQKVWKICILTNHILCYGSIHWLLYPMTMSFATRARS